MKPGSIIIIIIAVVLLLVAFLAIFGFIPLSIPGFNTDIGGEDMPTGADYCGFSDGQILDMIETVSGKDLNNEIGLSYVDALNMKACASDDWNLNAVEYEYKEKYDDYYIYGQQSTSGSGWNGLLIGWTNDPDPSASTYGKAIIAGSGNTVKEMYGYNTIVISGSGTIVAFVGFAMFLNAS